MATSPKRTSRASTSTVDVPTRVVAVAEVEIAYRDIRPDHRGGVPLVALTHLGANLDSWDPEVIDPLAADRRVILVGYRGVGKSSGAVRDSFEKMAADTIAVITSLGLTRVDLLGLSMGGMVAQEIIDQAPELVDRVILASTGPQGGPGMTRMSGLMIRGILRGVFTLTNPTTLLFFTRTVAGKRAARDYQARLKLRVEGRDTAVRFGVIRSQLRAVKKWGSQRALAEVEGVGPVLILHGDLDRMVPVDNVDALLVRFPHALTQIFPDSGHGVVSQNRQAITATIARFLSR